MIKSLILNCNQWHRLKQRLIADHGRSILLIRERTRTKLGFTVREHIEYQLKYPHRSIKICLDFFDESKKTFFLLKYSEYVQNNN